jgi:hypothetical protein
MQSETFWIDWEGASLASHERIASADGFRGCVVSRWLAPGTSILPARTASGGTTAYGLFHRWITSEAGPQTGLDRGGARGTDDARWNYWLRDLIRQLPGPTGVQPAQPSVPFPRIELLLNVSTTPPVPTRTPLAPLWSI